jgi:hypothetical protein
MTIQKEIANLKQLVSEVLLNLELNKPITKSLTNF